MKRALLACALALTACDGPRDAMIAGVAREAESALAPANLPAFFDCLRENGAVIVSAHRGGPAPGYAENAIPTFERTLTQAPAFLEIDIARTRDGALVLMHDDDVARTTTGEGLVRDLTLAEFQALTLEDDDGLALDAHPPTLREALVWAADKTVLELDVKRGVSYEDVVREVTAADALGRVVFVTYSVDGARRIHRLAPEAMIYTTIEDEGDLADLDASRIDPTRIIAWTGTDEPDSALNVELAQRGIEVRFGTLGGGGSWDARFERSGDDQYAEFAETGLQMIATNRPAEAVRDLDANGFGGAQCATAR